jgi:transcriptional regulator with XRE-family HTH domain
VPSPRPSREIKRSPEYAAACRQFGLCVRTLRQAAGLTLDRASSAAEIDLAHWQKIEAGRVNVTLGTMLRLAKAVHAELSDLFPKEKGLPSEPTHASSPTKRRAPPRKK